MVEIDVVDVLDEGAGAVKVEDVSEDIVIVEGLEDSAARVVVGPLGVPTETLSRRGLPASRWLAGGFSLGQVPRVCGCPC